MSGIYLYPLLVQDLRDLTRARKAKNKQKYLAAAQSLVTTLNPVLGVIFFIPPFAYLMVSLQNLQIIVTSSNELYVFGSIVFFSAMTTVVELVIFKKLLIAYLMNKNFKSKS